MGLTLSLVLVALPQRDRGDARHWPFRTRAAVLVSAGIVSVILVSPQVLGASRYAPLIGPADLDTYPEADIGGRYVPSERSAAAAFHPPFDSYSQTALPILEWVVLGAGEPVSNASRRWLEQDDTRLTLALSALFIVVVVGAVRLSFHRSSLRRVFIFGLPPIIGHTLASTLAPYLFIPERYVMYPLPILAVCLLPVSITGLLPVEYIQKKSSMFRGMYVAGACIVLLLLFGGKGSTDTGLTMDVRTDRLLYQHVESLPPDSVIAGWPTGPVNDIPYLTKRTAFVTQETHQAYHASYADEMRRRTFALVDAYFATDIAPFERLRDEFGVIHLIVRRSHLSGDTPTYFKPFDTYIEASVTAMDGMPYEIDRQLDVASWYEDDRFAILDLSRLRRGD